MASSKDGRTSNGNSGSTGDTLRVALLVDESGSMASMQPAVIAGINEFISELKADADGSTRVLASLAMFDLSGGEPPVRVRFNGLPGAKVRPLGPHDYAPRGMTPLNDAVATTIRALRKRAGKGDRVMVVVLTDGLENSSETSSEELRELIVERERDGWEFVYLGANHDTWAATESIGINQRGKHFAWEASPAGVDAALKVGGDRVKRFRDNPAEYRQELASLDDRVTPGESKARRLSEAEIRNARRR